jgi:flagellar basal-body rod modification protein FlgD
MSTVQTQPISSSVLNAANGTSSATGAASASGTESTQQMSADFMTMLVAQMKYQDPTKPVDSAQMTSQLAQISTVDGINKLNSTMSALATSLSSNQALQASSLIGKQVLAPGNSVELAGGQSQFGIQLSSAADTVKVNILNPAGQVVNTMNLGAQVAGTMPVTWNGTSSTGGQLPDGNYTFQVLASVGTSPVSATSLAYSAVTSVSNSTTGAMLNLGNNQSVSTNDVQRIL